MASAFFFARMFYNVLMDIHYTIAFGPHKQSTWEGLYQQSQGAAALQQSFAYGEMARAMGTYVQRAVISQYDRPVALWQATQKRLFRLRDVSLGLRGPVWLSKLSETEKIYILQLIKREMKGITLLMPEEEQGFQPTGMRPIITGYSCVMIDLQRAEEVLLAAQEGKWRNRLRVAERANLRVDRIGLKPENYGWLIEEEYSQRERLGYKALSPLAVPIYQECAGKHSLLGLQAWQGNERVAAMLFLLHGSCASYHIGWSSEAGKKANAHNLLLWEAVLRLKKQGYNWLDLGRVSSEESEGLTRFKLGSGGKWVTLCGTYL